MGSGRHCCPACFCIPAPVSHWLTAARAGCVLQEDPEDAVHGGLFHLYYAASQVCDAVLRCGPLGPCAAHPPRVLCEATMNPSVHMHSKRSHP